MKTENVSVFSHSTITQIMCICLVKYVKLDASTSCGSARLLSLNICMCVFPAALDTSTSSESGLDGNPYSAVAGTGKQASDVTSRSVSVCVCVCGLLSQLMTTGQRELPNMLLSDQTNTLQCYNTINDQLQQEWTDTLDLKWLFYLHVYM